LFNDFPFITQFQHKFLALFCIFLFYDWPFLHVRNPEENLLFSALIFGSLFSDYVVFYGDYITLHRSYL